MISEKSLIIAKERNILKDLLDFTNYFWKIREFSQKISEKVANFVKRSLKKSRDLDKGSRKKREIWQTILKKTRILTNDYGKIVHFGKLSRKTRKIWQKIANFDKRSRKKLRISPSGRQKNANLDK